MRDIISLISGGADGTYQTDYKFHARTGVDDWRHIRARLFIRVCSWLQRPIVMSVTMAAVLGLYLLWEDLHHLAAWWKPTQVKQIHDWTVVNAFGDSKCLVDKRGLEKRGDIVRAVVMYETVPPGIDKRNNKAVKAMLNVEDYDLRTRTFRVQRVTFQYVDGRESEPLQTGPEWKPATAGNQRTLEFLQGLDYPDDGSISVGGVVLDKTFAGFTRGAPADNEATHPGLGHSVPYQSERRDQATAYVYNKGRRDIADGPMSDTVMEEFNEATQEVLAFGHTTSPSPSIGITLDGRYTTGAPDRGTEFLCAEFILSDEHGLRRTFLYLTGAAGNFVKIRATLRTNDAADPTARNFADAVAHRLRW